MIGHLVQCHNLLRQVQDHQKEGRDRKVELKEDNESSTVLLQGLDCNLHFDWSLNQASDCSY